MNELLNRFLCTIGLHQVPEERRRWTSIGWYGHCTRCGAKRTGMGGY